jgi:predicted short-subunit dehydrogenase-like oxidoreductase (DUF2520 family)
MRELERDLPSRSAIAHEAVIPALAVVGAGRVGSSLARGLADAGVDVRLAGRTDAIDACRGAGAALLCVPDAAIGEAARAIASGAPDLAFAGHTSGASGLDVLAPLAATGAAAFSLHPLQTVPDRQTGFTGCPAAISGSTAAALELGRAIAERLGMRPFEIPEERRAAYHAAASIASNFLVALEESAASLLAEAGAPDARELLTPLVLTTAANWSERGAAALTGPIARGDEATVARHLDALREVAPELVPLYETLAERTREVAEEDGG